MARKRVRKIRFDVVGFATILILTIIMSNRSLIKKLTNWGNCIYNSLSRF